MFKTAAAATSSVHRPTHRMAKLTALLAVPTILASMSAAAVGAVASPTAKHPVPRYCHSGGQLLWHHLATCGWPGESNTGPDLADCPRHHLVPRGHGTRPIVLSRPNEVVRCADLRGRVLVRAANVTIINSTVDTHSGTRAEATGAIMVEPGASATISHVTINGGNSVHACIWHEGTHLMVKAVDCFGAHEGVFTWALTSQPTSGGDNFTIQDSYFHGFAKETVNGHDNGFQTEGSSNGLINHNTFHMNSNATSAVAIWDSRRSSNDITVSNNLITGGGFAIYAEDYNPGDSAPGDPAAIGGFSVTDVQFDHNSFSTVAGGCVGQYGVWFTRPTWEPYHGGPTDGWHRLGNVVLETGEHIDHTNPHNGATLCR